MPELSLIHISVLRERIVSTMYLWHNYGKSPIGSKEDIERVPIANLAAFYRKSVSYTHLSSMDTKVGSPPMVSRRSPVWRSFSTPYPVALMVAHCSSV